MQSHPEKLEIMAEASKKMGRPDATQRVVDLALGPGEVDNMFGKKPRVHMVGIGGSGMCGIAEVLLDLGHAVSGSDVKESAVTERLTVLGAQI